MWACKYVIYVQVSWAQIMLGLCMWPSCRSQAYPDGKNQFKLRRLKREMCCMSCSLQLRRRFWQLGQCCEIVFDQLTKTHALRRRDISDEQIWTGKHMYIYKSIWSPVYGLQRNRDGADCASSGRQWRLESIVFTSSVSSNLVKWVLGNEAKLSTNQLSKSTNQDSSRASSFAQHLRVRFKCWRDLRKEAAGDCWSAVEQLKQRETSLIKACHKNQARMDWMRAVMNLPLQCAILLCQHQLQQQSSHRGCP